MAEKIKLTKTDLKKQKDSLKRYTRYLPTLQLKKQQLQMVIRQLEIQMEEKVEDSDFKKTLLEQWIQVFGEGFDISSYLKLEELKTETKNIAGVEIPSFLSIKFKETDYSLFYVPVWIDFAMEELKKIIQCDVELSILKKQLELLQNEMRTTSQRVNLFEKVKIPESKSNIRKIQIALGDEQTASVVRGKISKNKVNLRE